jgi:hypothetical protein
MPRCKPAGATMFCPITLAGPSDSEITGAAHCCYTTSIGGIVLILALVTAGAVKGVRRQLANRGDASREPHHRLAGRSRPAFHPARAEQSPAGDWGAYTASRYDHLTFAESGASLVSVLPVMAGTALGVKIRRHIFPFLIFSMVIASAVDLIVAPLLPSVAFFASTGQP